MEFLFGVLVGGMVVGGVVLAKVMANKAEAAATPSRYLTGWNPQEADDTGHLTGPVVPDKPVEIDPIPGDGLRPL